MLDLLMSIKHDTKKKKNTMHTALEPQTLMEGRTLGGPMAFSRAHCQVLRRAWEPLSPTWPHSWLIEEKEESWTRRGKQPHKMHSGSAHFIGLEMEGVTGKDVEWKKVIDPKASASAFIRQQQHYWRGSQKRDSKREPLLLLRNRKGEIDWRGHLFLPAS